MIHDQIHIIGTGRGFSTASGGAFFSCNVGPADIKQVHAEMIACQNEDDLWTIKSKWHQKDFPPGLPGESLIAVPLIFELRIPGSTVEEIGSQPRSYEVWNTRDTLSVKISMDYKVTYQGKEYFSHDFEPYTPTGSNDLRTKQTLVISSLQRVLMHILKTSVESK